MVIILLKPCQPVLGVPLDVKEYISHRWIPTIPYAPITIRAHQIEETTESTLTTEGNIQPRKSPILPSSIHMCVRKTWRYALSNCRFGLMYLSARQNDSWLCHEYLTNQRIDGHKNSSTWTSIRPIRRAAQIDMGMGSPGSLQVRPKDSKEPIQIHVRLDVINVDLPFLIGLPSLKAMGATLNFRYSNISLVINQTVYILDLIHQALHIIVPLWANAAVREHWVQGRLDHISPKHLYWPKENIIIRPIQRTSIQKRPSGLVPDPQLRLQIKKFMLHVNQTVWPIINA